MRIVDIKRNIGQLSVKNRADLVRWIIINFDEIDKGEQTVDASWRREVRTRGNDILSGKVKMIPSEEMWKDILFNYETPTNPVIVMFQTGGVCLVFVAESEI